MQMAPRLRGPAVAGGVFCPVRITVHSQGGHRSGGEVCEGGGTQAAASSLLLPTSAPPWLGTLLGF